MHRQPHRASLCIAMAFCVRLNSSELQLCHTITTVLSSTFDPSTFKQAENKEAFQVAVLRGRIQRKSKAHECMQL